MKTNRIYALGLAVLFGGQAVPAVAQQYLATLSYHVYSLLYTREGVLYAGTASGNDPWNSVGVVYKSVDQGTNWTATADLGGLNVVGNVEGLIQTTGGSIDGDLFISSAWNGRVYHSDNGGGTWTYLFSMLGGGSADCMLQAANGDIYVTCGGSQGYINRSTDEGVTWPIVGSPANLPGMSVMEFIKQTTNGTFFCSGVPCHIWRSPDGVNWTKVADQSVFGSSPYKVYSMIEAQDGSLYVSVRNQSNPVDAGVWRSTDFGTNWTQTGTSAELGNSSRYDIVFQSQCGVFFVGNLNGQVYRSLDGDNWTLAAYWPGRRVNKIVEGPKCKLFIGTSFNGEIYTMPVDTNAPVLPDLPAGGYLGWNPDPLPSCTEGLLATDDVSGQLAVACEAGPILGDSMSKTQEFTYAAQDCCGNVATGIVIYTWNEGQFGTVSGHLYIDANGNGTQDPGEPDLPNVDVIVTDSRGNVTTNATDANGDWTASVPPGTTTADVDETDPDFPSGYIQTEGTDPTTVTAVAGEDTPTDNDGYFLPAIVSGHLYYDVNGNGTQDPGEPDLANVDVLVTDSLGNVTTNATDANGDWTAIVPPGTTTANVDESDPDYPAGYIQTEGTDPTTVTAVAGVNTPTDNDGYFSPAPAIGVQKTASGGAGEFPGGELVTGTNGAPVTYWFVVSNTGNVTLSNVSLSDPLLGFGYLTNSLAAGQSVTVSVARIITVDLTNTVTATGYDPAGAPHSATDTAQVDLIAPGLSVAKTVSTGPFPGGELVSGTNGTPVTYWFVVHNTGDVEMTSVNLSDPLLGYTQFPIGNLAAGQSVTASWTRIIMADLTNTVTVTGNDPTGAPHSASDTAQVDLIAPGIELVKTAGPKTFTAAGEVINYSFMVRNTGDATLTNITVTDANPLVIVSGGPLAELAPGASNTTTFTASYTIQPADVAAGEFVNTATATGRDPAGGTVSGTDEETVCRNLVVIPPPDVTVECSDDFSPNNTGSATAESGCDCVVTNLSYSDAPEGLPGRMSAKDNGGCRNNYVLLRTWTAEDDCGNRAVATQRITVQDTTPPSITCPSNLTVQCRGDVPAADPASVTASDNCGMAAVYWVGDEDDGQTCPKTITRTYRATDECGNSADCTQTITVHDTQAPEFIGNPPPDLTVECEPPPWAILTATDHCDGQVEVVTNETPEAAMRRMGGRNNVDCNYALQRTWTATDACGNATVWTQTILVVDTEAPTLMGVPADATVACIRLIPPPPAVTALDNCSASEMPGDGLLLHYAFSEGSGETAVDHSGHGRDGVIHGASFVHEGVAGGGLWFDGMLDYVQGTDAGFPAGSEPRSVSWWFKAEELNPSSNYFLIQYGAETDNGLCAWGVDARSSPVRVYYTTQGPEYWSGEPLAPGQWYHAVYTYGGGSDHAFYINGKPSFGGAPMGAPATVLNNLLRLGWGSSAAPFRGILDEVRIYNRPLTPAEAQALASEIPVSFSETTQDNCPWTVTRVWTAMDRCGNAASATQTITVVDTRPPVLSGCPGDVTVQCEGDVPEPAGVTATDICVGEVPAVLVETRSDGNCPHDYVLTRTWTATDPCGNSAECVQIITVADTTPPVLPDLPPCGNLGCHPEALPTCAEDLWALDNCSAEVPVLCSAGAVTGEGNDKRQTFTYSATDACGNAATAVVEYVWRVDCLVSINGRVWNDFNFNGLQDAGEPGLANVKVGLFVDAANNGNFTTRIATATTGLDGHYLFADLAEGAYVVAVDTGSLPAGLAQTGDPDWPGMKTPPAERDHRTTDPLVLIVGEIETAEADFGYVDGRLLAIIGNVEAFTRDGQTVVRWETIESWGTAGFWLERLVADQWMRISRDLLPFPVFGTAPIVYEELDPGAEAGGTHRWRLVELENDGDELVYGPYELTVDGPGRTYSDWAATHFSPEELADSAISGKDEDPDGDELTNWQEFLAGTDPLRRNTVLQITDIRKTAGGLELRWDSKAGGTYRIALSGSLAGPFLPLEERIQAAGDSVGMILPVDFHDRQMFFQVILVSP